MDNKRLILNIINLYQEARISKFQHNKIRRGGLVLFPPIQKIYLRYFYQKILIAI